MFASTWEDGIYSGALRALEGCLWNNRFRFYPLGPQNQGRWGGCTCVHFLGMIFSADVSRFGSSSRSFELCRCSSHAGDVLTTCPHITCTCPLSVLRMSFPRRPDVIRRRWACLCCVVGNLVSDARCAPISIKAAPLACPAMGLSESCWSDTLGFHICVSASPGPCTAVAWHTAVPSASSELASALVADSDVLWL